jgi:hypothetical protein
MATNHVSNLLHSTLCGLLNKELPAGDRSLAALNDETQAMVNCEECRAKLGLK